MSDIRLHYIKTEVCVHRKCFVYLYSTEGQTQLGAKQSKAKQSKRFARVRFPKREKREA